VANHLSFNDPPLLVVTIKRRLNFIGKHQLFGNPISRFTMKEFGVFPFDRSGHSVDMVRLTLRLLSEDRALVLFPEGRRSADCSLQKGLPGAAYIAMKSQATILPVGISGTENVPPWRVLFPLCRMTVNIGQPFTLPMIEGRPSRQLLESMADMIMYRIAALLPDKYHGVYALPPPNKPESIPPAASHSGDASGVQTE
jgi:1-acyl-sn-glycerol-3-phosphate acyltransferase